MNLDQKSVDRSQTNNLFSLLLTVTWFTTRKCLPHVPNVSSPLINYKNDFISVKHTTSKEKMGEMGRANFLL